MTHLNHLSLYVSQVAWFLPVSFFNVQIYFFGLATDVKYNRKQRFSVESLEAIEEVSEQLAPWTISPRRLAPSVWTISPQYLDD